MGIAHTEEDASLHIIMKCKEKLIFSFIKHKEFSYSECLNSILNCQDLENTKKALNLRKRLPTLKKVSKIKSVFYQCKYIEDLKKKKLN